MARNNDKDRRPVIINHGIFASADSFILDGKDALAFKLLDSGYDVWLANNRGNKYSRENLRFNPNQEQYFDFSFAEMGIYDIPAMVDYVRDFTRREKVSYIAHS